MTSRSTARSRAPHRLFQLGLRFGYALLGCGVVACSGVGDPTQAVAEADPPGSTRGELQVYAASFEDGHKEMQYTLRLPSGDERPLQFRAEPTAAPGTSIRVWGALSGDALQVDSWEVVQRASAELASQSEALVNVTPEPSRRMCVVMVDIGVPFGTRLTNALIDASFFTGANSVDAFYRENSYGKTGLDGKVYGPFPYTIGACDTRGMATAMKAQLAMTGETCDQYAYVMGQTSACAWGGLGAVGTPVAPARDTWYNGSVSCVVAVQEPGHNYGMAHSSSLACGPTGALTTFATNPSTACRHSEYGDRFDPMGGACRHMNVWQKQYERWMGPCNTVKVPSSGTFNLLPTEQACDGIQALQVPLPAPITFTRPAGGGSSAGTDTLTNYYLEYRTSAGFDTGLAPMVLLHVAGEPPSQTATGRAAGGKHTWLLDTHPAGTGAFNDAGFKAGETYTDPAGGLTITVVSMDADKAVVRIDRTGGTGDPVCALDNTPFTGGEGMTACGTAPPPPPTDGGVVTPPPPRRDAGGVDVPPATRDAGTPIIRADGGPAAPEPSRIEAGAAEASEPSTPPLSITPDAAAPAADSGLGGSIPPHDPVDGVEGGCSCRTAPGGSGAEHAGKAAFGLALALVAARRVRRRRAS